MTSVHMNNKDAQVELFPEVMMVLSTDIILTSSESNLQEKFCVVTVHVFRRSREDFIFSSRCS